jgi:hypothetical protein
MARSEWESVCDFRFPISTQMLPLFEPALAFALRFVQ